MKIMDRLFRFFGAQLQVADEPRSHLLNPVEIHLVADGRVERLAEFAASPRLHLVDPKGDTPLHLAARSGNLALCDLFIRAGANPETLNHERQTPADVALAEGHSLVAQLLFSLVPKPLNTAPNKTSKDIPEVEAPADKIEAVPEPRTEDAPPPDQIVSADGLDDLLNFEAEEDAKDFFRRMATETASGTFAALVSPSPMIATVEEGDWEIDLSLAQIAGEGIGSEEKIAPERGNEHDFLKVRNRGRQSLKRALIQPGTRMSINPEISSKWAEDVLAKGWFTLDDMETLIALCEGNGDPEEMRISLERNLEAAGLELVTEANENCQRLWDTKSDISRDELAEAVEAAFTRATRLPGTRRFTMDKSDEVQLFEPMIRAKQELQLSMLGCKAAVETTLDVVDRVRRGLAEPGTVTLRFIAPTRPNDAETAEFFSAAEALRLWHATGRIMDGKRRREAIEALEALDLSLTCYKEIVESLKGLDSSCEDGARLEGLISIFEAATKRLVLEHLPYARRFATRNVADGEDLEDVFQVAFTGLQRSTRRFDSKRGVRFAVYCTFWMKQALTRWRADEGAAIRIPVHRHENFAALDGAIELLSTNLEGTVSDGELALELGWIEGKVRQLRLVPRQCEYPDSVDEWEKLLPKAQVRFGLDQAETVRIVADILAELPEKQADVIRMRFGIGRDEEMTLEEIGRIYGVTRERIRQIEAKGLKNLALPGRKRRLQSLLGM